MSARCGPPGLTPVEVQRAIEAALKDKAIEPQVIVTVTSSPSTFVTVAGDVRQPGRVAAQPRRRPRARRDCHRRAERRRADYNTFVRLTRGSSSATVSLARVVRDNDQNIYLRPNDLVYVYSDPQVYTAFGATLAKCHCAVHHRPADAGGSGRRGRRAERLPEPTRMAYSFSVTRIRSTFEAVREASPKTVGDPAVTSGRRAGRLQARLQGSARLLRRAALPHARQRRALRLQRGVDRHAKAPVGLHRRHRYAQPRRPLSQTTLAN